jgi:hypothetical protein
VHIFNEVGIIEKFNIPQVRSQLEWRFANMFARRFAGQVQALPADSAQQLREQPVPQVSACGMQPRCDVR